MYPPFIAISGGTETTAIDKWASVVYEMFNLENGSDFTELSEAAVKGFLDADQYAAECVVLEFEATKKTRDFFLEHPLPKSNHERDTWYNWCTTEVDTLEAYVDSFGSSDSLKSNTNFNYFKNYYERTLMPYSEDMRRNE